MLTLTRQSDYAVQFLSALAKNKSRHPLSIKSFADEARLSALFLQHVARKLRAAEIVTSVKGTKGGYRLAKQSKDITLQKILEAVDGPVAIVPCLQMNAPKCRHESFCATRRSIGFVNSRINQYLNALTLTDLLMARVPEISAKKITAVI
ncbi:MAG: Rrf2 family transcriptional regulator [Candidatus Magasanikbacteria bacterium]|nr:Rrf2 family transcriptional regulator [Candidatus Magasanikbacteria bacterium]